MGFCPQRLSGVHQPGWQAGLVPDEHAEAIAQRAGGFGNDYLPARLLAALQEEPVPDLR